VMSHGAKVLDPIRYRFLLNVAVLSSDFRYRAAARSGSCKHPRPRRPAANPAATAATPPARPELPSMDDGVACYQAI
jgi:hypothetical protein